MTCFEKNTTQFLSAEQPKTAQSEGVLFQKKPLGRRRHLMSEPTGSANLVPLRLERSGSAASLE